MGRTRAISRAAPFPKAWGNILGVIGQNLQPPSCLDEDRGGCYTAEVHHEQPEMLPSSSLPWAGAGVPPPLHITPERDLGSS